MTDILACNGVGKSFHQLSVAQALRVGLGGVCLDGDEREVLRGIDLTLKAGEFVGIIGGNGAGKSTLLRILGGVYSANTGSVAVLGDCWGLYELGLAGHRELTGRDYCSQQLRLCGLRGDRLATATAWSRDYSELGERFDQDAILTYSDGMRSRLFFATAFAVEHDIYLLDEVLAVGDEHFSAKCWRTVRERVAAGAAGILVTHHFASILKLCARCLVLDGGRITDSGPAREVIARRLNAGTNIKARTDLARFVMVPRQVAGHTGDDLHIPLSVAIDGDNLKVSVGFSIEIFDPAIGWEIVLIDNTVALIEETGTFDVAITVPRLPLKAGTFSLNLFLFEWFDRSKIHHASVLYDDRRWSLGSDIPLVVTGDRGLGGLLSLPLSWHLEDA